MAAREGDPVPDLARRIWRAAPAITWSKAIDISAALSPQIETTAVGDEKRVPFTAEDLARAWFIADRGQDTSREYAEEAWEDMGGSEPSWERGEYEIRAEYVMSQLVHGREINQTQKVSGK